MLRQEWVNVNARMGRAGDTGLHVASEKGHLNVVKFLLGFGRKNLNLNIENDRGGTPLSLAACGGHRPIARALLKARNLKLKGDQVKRVMKEVFSGDSIDFEIAKMILNEYKCREGREFDAALSSHVDKCAELAQKSGLEARKSLVTHQKEIQKWLDSTLSKKPSQESPQSKTRDELLQDMKEHCECGICYEEYRVVQLNFASVWCVLFDTGWGGHLFRRFCNFFSKVSLACLGTTAAAVQPNSLGTFRKHFIKPLEQVAAPPSRSLSVLSTSMRKTREYSISGLKSSWTSQ